MVEALRGDWLTQGPRVTAFEERSRPPAARRTRWPSRPAPRRCTPPASPPASVRATRCVTSAITFAASANCAAYVGATPRFADIDPATWNVSAETVARRADASARARSSRSSFTGLPAPVAEMRAALGPDVVLIEDAAHAIGGRRPDGPVGDGAARRHDDLLVPSRQDGDHRRGRRDHAARPGAARAAARLPLARHDQGPGAARAPRRGRLVHGAARARLQLPDHRPPVRARAARSWPSSSASSRARNAIADALPRGARADVVELPPAAPPRRAARLPPVRRSTSPDRRALYDALRERGIFAQVHYLPVYLHPWYRETYGYEPGLCPEAEAYYAGCLSLPCFPALTEAEQDDGDRRRPRAASRPPQPGAGAPVARRAGRAHGCAWSSRAAAPASSHSVVVVGRVAEAVRQRLAALRRDRSCQVGRCGMIT